MAPSRLTCCCRPPATTYAIAAIEADPIVLNARLGHYTNFVNLLDLAAIAVPAGFRADRLPFGISLIAPAGGDAALARLGAELHRRLGPRLGATAHLRPPPLAGAAPPPFPEWFPTAASAS